MKEVTEINLKQVEVGSNSAKAIKMYDIKNVTSVIFLQQKQNETKRNFLFGPSCLW